MTNILFLIMTIVTYITTNSLVDFLFGFCCCCCFLLFYHGSYAAIKAGLLRVYALKIFSQNSLWRILSCFIMLLLSHSSSVVALIFFCLYSPMKLFRNAVQNDWIFLCIRIKIRSKRMEVIHKISTHILCDLWLWQMWYVKRETLQALLIYLDLKLWFGSHIKRRYFVFASKMRLNFMDIVRCRRCVLALMSPFLQNIWHKGSLVSIPYHQPRWFYSSIKLSVLISNHNSLAAHLTTSFELIPNFFIRSLDMTYVSTPAAIQINHKFICLYYIITEQNHTRVPV